MCWLFWFCLPGVERLMPKSAKRCLHRGNRICCVVKFHSLSISFRKSAGCCMFAFTVCHRIKSLWSCHDAEWYIIDIFRHSTLVITESWTVLVSSLHCLVVKLFAQRNDTETQQFQNLFSFSLNKTLRPSRVVTGRRAGHFVLTETKRFQIGFVFIFISLCEQLKSCSSHAGFWVQGCSWNVVEF